MNSQWTRLLDKLDGKEYDSYFSAWCPFDEHKAPALLVYEDGYFCMSCERGGTLDYLENNLSILPTKQPVYSGLSPKWTQWEKRYGCMDNIADIAHRFVLQGNDLYFKNRKLAMFLHANTVSVDDTNYHGKFPL